MACPELSDNDDIQEVVTKTDLHEMVDRYCRNLTVETCDLLCTVCDALPGQPEGEFTVEQIRDMIDESDLPE
jgi:hypothetical protein